ncbi:MAG: DUF3795 domain-containing protein [Clostridia bacterium]|jgi:hypothetical protein|nr:DUF3795 domain-containing protein [Clostridia bacterium]
MGRERRYPEIGGCGINCSLCPKKYTVGKSQCDGCCSKGFWDELRMCPMASCLLKSDKEFCYECELYPCEKNIKFQKWDSFVSHEKTLDVLGKLKVEGLNKYLGELEIREKIFKELVEKYNNGRMKTFYSRVVILFELSALEEIHRNITSNYSQYDKEIKDYIKIVAIENNINLKSRKGV